MGLKRAELEAQQEKTRLRKIKEEAQNLDIGVWIPESSDNLPAVDDVEAPESRQVLALAPFQESLSPLLGVFQVFVLGSCALTSACFGMYVYTHRPRLLKP